MLVTVSPLAPVKQIEIIDPEKKVKRSKIGEKGKEKEIKGSIHFRPGSTKELTEDEFNYIKKNDKEFFKFLSKVVGGGAVKTGEEKEEKEEEEVIEKPSKKNKYKG